MKIDQALLLLEVQAARPKPPKTVPRMGTVQNYIDGTRVAFVRIDGDTVDVAIKSTVGTLSVFQRVVVEFYGKHGARVVGTF